VPETKVISAQQTAPTKVGFVSLGCPKNLVDSEVMMGMLADGGAELVARAEDALDRIPGRRRDEAEPELVKSEPRAVCDLPAEGDDERDRSKPDEERRPIGGDSDERDRREGRGEADCDRRRGGPRRLPETGRSGDTSPSIYLEPAGRSGDRRSPTGGEGAPRTVLAPSRLGGDQ